VTCSDERSGVPQNVHGPMPSLTHMIFPQFKQFGAAARRGCRVARHVQRRAAGEELEREGLVCTSRVRIAESCKANLSVYCPLAGEKRNILDLGEW